MKQRGADKYLTAPASFIQSIFNKYFLAFFQSNYSKYFIYKNSDTTGAGDIMLNIQSLVKLPVPMISKKYQQPIEKLIDDILDLFNSENKESNKTSLDHLKVIESAINQKIYSIFGFTESEIRYIEDFIA